MNRIEEAFQNITRSADGLQGLRSQAFDELTRLQVPSKKDEAWKYTNPRGFLDAAWNIADPAQLPVDLTAIPFAQMESEALLVFVDGRLRKDLSKGNLKSSSLVKKNLPETALSAADFFERMNLALLNEGTVIELDAKEYERPIVLLYVGTRSSNDFAANYRVQLKVPTNARASILEAHVSIHSAGSTSQIVTQVEVCQNAFLNYVKVQSSSRLKHLNSSAFKLSRSSRLETTQITIGGELVRNNLTVTFAEEGAEAVVNGLYLGCGTEHIDNRTLIDHAVGNTISSQLYKGVLDDSARAVFAGGVRIRKNAQKANSSQLNNNLMLSQKAEIDTKPELEIEADDVKAAHGAAIGQINPDHVFYLQSRALSKQQAVEMLAFGFAQDIVDRVPDKNIREVLSTLVKHKFSDFKVSE